MIKVKLTSLFKPRNYDFLLILILILIISIIYIPFSLSNGNLFSSPDENTMFHFINKYSNSGKMEDVYNYNIKKTYGAIKPRMSIVINNKIVPVLPNGIIITAGTFNNLINNFSFIFTPIVFSISVLYLFKLIGLFLSKKIAFLSAIEYATLAPLIYLATKPLVIDAATLSLLVIGIFYFYSNRNNMDIFLSGMFLGMTLYMNHKYYFILFAFFFIEFLTYIFNLFFIVKEKKSKYIINLIKVYVIFSIGFIPYFLIILITDTVLYGNFLHDGYIAESKLYALNGGISLPVFYISYDKILQNINYYLINLLTPIFTLISVLGVLLIRKTAISKNKPLLVKFLFFTLVVCIIILGYFASIATWGYNLMTISASFVRYLLPLYTFLIPFFCLFIFTKLKKHVSVITLCLLNSFSIITFLAGPGGYSSIKSYISNVAQIRENTIKKTTPKSIIFTNSYDKVLFPYRSTVDIGSLPVKVVNNSAQVDQDKLVSLMSYLYQKNYNIFIMNDFDPAVFNSIKYKLNTKGFKLKPDFVSNNDQIAEIVK